MTATTCPIYDWCERDHSLGDNSPGDCESTPARLTVTGGEVRTQIYSLDAGAPRLFVAMPDEPQMTADDINALIDHLAMQKQIMQARSLAVTA
jgi:hypothetical protein